MRTLVIALPVLLALGLVAAAQMQGPPPEMKKFDVMLGNWEGTGTANMGADSPAGEWKAVSTVKKILGGHFVQENMRIDVGPEMPPMIFFTVYYWDATAKRYMMHSCANMGGAFYECPVYWTKDGKMVSGAVSIQRGAVTAEHWVTEFGENEIRIKALGAHEGGEFFVYVEGSMKRGGPGYAVTAESAEIGQGTPDEHLKAFAPMAGNWGFKGRMKMMPGSPWTEISGQETVEPILGGHVYLVKLIGDEVGDLPRYEMVGFMGWDAQTKCLRRMDFSTYGPFEANAYAVGEKRIVLTSSAVYQGSPVIGRTVYEYSADGNTIKTWSNSITGDREPQRCFEGTYTRTKT